MKTITLYHYDFESDNQNVLLFDSKTSRDAYFNNIAESDKVKIQDINFFANDLLNTRVYVRVDSLSLFTILNYNYAIVTDSDDETHPLFYHIESSKQDSGGQIEITLKCDIANTYFYDIDFNVVQAIVKRAHLDRFKASDTADFYLVNFGADSKLYEREVIKDMSKRVVKQSDIYISYSGSSAQESESVNWLKEHVICWKYYFLTKNQKYNFHKVDGTSQNDYLQEMYYTKGIQDPIKSEFLVLASPVYREGSFRQIKFNIGNNNILDWNDESIAAFLENNNGYAYVKSIKYSVKPPLYVRSAQFANSTIDERANLIVNVSNLSYGTNRPFNTDLNIYLANNNANLFYVVFIDDINPQKAFISDVNFATGQTNGELLNWFYAKSRIKAHNDIEPKLLNEDYSIYKLMFAGQQYILPISKTSYNPKFEYNEIMSPDITKAILQYNSTNDDLKTLLSTYEPVYNSLMTNRDFTGFVIDLDLSMWFATSQLDTYLANNKNYKQIKAVGSGQTALKSATTIGTAAAVGSLLPGIGTAVGAAVGAIGAVTNLITDCLEYSKIDKTLDNMANAPETTSDINSNPILMTSENKIGFIIEKLEPLPFEKQILLDYFRQFGYTYNKVDTIANVMRSRKYYNFIQANIFEIPAQIGNNIKEEIKKMFSNGIRLWHADTFEGVDFTLNNYERFIDEQEN